MAIYVKIQGKILSQTLRIIFFFSLQFCLAVILSFDKSIYRRPSGEIVYHDLTCDLRRASTASSFTPTIRYYIFTESLHAHGESRSSVCSPLTLQFIFNRRFESLSPTWNSETINTFLFHFPPFRRPFPFIVKEPNFSHELNHHFTRTRGSMCLSILTWFNESRAKRKVNDITLKIQNKTDDSMIRKHFYFHLVSNFSTTETEIFTKFARCLRWNYQRLK